MEHPQTIDFTVHGPVYTLDEYKLSPEGTTLSNVKGLPMKAQDLLDPQHVHQDRQTARARAPSSPAFGNCKPRPPAAAAAAICRFPGGLRFWSHNQDVGAIRN